jgi:hypothetical protein
MTVDQLITELKKHPGDLPVVKEWFNISRDMYEWELNLSVAREEVLDVLKRPTGRKAVVIR